MPEISRFFGIIVRMYFEPGVQHHIPHFHVYYQEAVGVFSIDPVELVAGFMPRKQQRLVEAWAELHQIELTDNWNRLQAGKTAVKIEPLK